ncbi:MAG TPA: ABC transporter permease [Ktedonobacteraceae bacterium]|nr:ABC transporter permease [Ktedonobacteraceae bacterium]
MVQFLVKRLIGLVFVLVIVTFITFILGYFSPGDPILTMLGQHPDPRIYASLKHQYGLDLPWYQQYFNFLGNLVHFSFGYSYHYQGRPVIDLLRDGIPASTELGLWGLILTVLLGIPIGIFAALKANTWLDTLSMGVSLILYAVPTFVFAVFVQVGIIWLNQIGIQWPVANWGQNWHYSWADIQYKLAPVIVFAAVGFAYLARISRSSMLEVLRQDYVRTARAKGLRERVVIYRHALRNAMIPLATVLGLSIGTLVVGIFFIESIFNIPGIGSAGLNAIQTLDFPVIQATVVLGAISIVVGNFLSDIFYSLADPRIKTE